MFAGGGGSECGPSTPCGVLRPLFIFARWRTFCAMSARFPFAVISRHEPPPGRQVLECGGGGVGGVLFSPPPPHTARIFSRGPPQHPKGAPPQPPAPPLQDAGARTQ